MASAPSNPPPLAARRSFAIDPAAKDAFWLVVEACLVRFHGHDPLRAVNEARSARRRLESGPPIGASDLIYHAEPFYLACDLAGLTDIRKQERLLGNRRPDYDLILNANDW